MPQRYDLVVIGSGPAGEKGAARAAYFGRRVAIVERASVLGGASVNTGTIPSKTLRETALYFSGLRQRRRGNLDALRHFVSDDADILFSRIAIRGNEVDIGEQNRARER